MKRIRAKSGFTLAELLIVVAIIAVLVAISIPIFQAKIEEAQKATCESNCIALKHHIVAEILSGDTRTPAELLVEFQKKDNAKCPCGGQYLIYPSNEATEESGFEVICGKHSKEASLGVVTIRDSVIKNILTAKNTATLSKGDNLDSGAIGIDGSMSKQFVQEMDKQGLSMSSMNAVTWAWRQKDGKSGSLYWSSEDISKLKKDTTIPVMKYDAESDSYTVWYAKINIGYTDADSKQKYNIIGSTTEEIAIEGEKNYDNALKKYNELQQSSNDKN